MSEKVYSFTKVQKNRTNNGLYGMILGIAAIVLLVVLIILAAVWKGQMSVWASAAGYLGFGLSVFGLVMSGRAFKNDDVYGRFLRAGIIVNRVAIGLYILVVLIGVMSVIY